MKLIFIVLGSISLLLGLIGIFVPGLPTTPFLLLTAGLYLKGSSRLYHILLSNKYLNHYITDYYKNNGLTVKTKIYTITFMWLMILLSILFCLNTSLLRIIIVGVGLVGSIVMGFVIPTSKN